jgi:hypothetical protein
MYLEIEDGNVIAAGCVKEINENGQLLIQIEGRQQQSAAWIDFNSPLIHPCGYWDYIQFEIYKTQMSNQCKHRTIESFELPSFLLASVRINVIQQQGFKWKTFLKDRPKNSPVPFDLFTSEQREGMLDKYFPTSESSPYHLSCVHKLNPRCVWQSISQFTIKDLTDIYRGTGIVDSLVNLSSSESVGGGSSSSAAIRNENDGAALKSAIVLLPENFEAMFSSENYPNVSQIFVGQNNFISYADPHLLVGDSFNLLKESVELDKFYLAVIMTTCLYFSSSTVSSQSY